MPRSPAAINRVSVRDGDLTDAEKGQLRARGWRNRRPWEMPLKTEKYRPADYASEFDRGTVEHIEGWFNYSWHKLAIPDGSTVRSCNFSQRRPNTPAITGKNLTFIDCNLTNCAIDPSWTVVNCNTKQIWRVKRVVDDEGGPTEQVKAQFLAAHPSGLPATLVAPPDEVQEGDVF